MLPTHLSGKPSLAFLSGTESPQEADEASRRGRTEGEAAAAGSTAWAGRGVCRKNCPWHSLVLSISDSEIGEHAPPRPGSPQ